MVYMLNYMMKIVIQSSPVAQVHFNFPPSLNVDIKNIFHFVW